jgi:hypothetical protein
VTSAGGSIEMKREESFLHIICLIAAAGFFAFIAYNFFASGSFISTDGLFFTVVPLVLALSFLAVPVMDTLDRRRSGKELESGDGQRQVGAGTGAPALKGASPPALKDLKGRAMPPDVNRIVAELKASRAKENQ